MKLIVSGMSCGHCKAAIEQAIAEAGGRAEVDLDSKHVKIEGLDQARAEEVIRNAGFEPQPA